MNTLITGGTGFIGARLAQRCLQRGDTVTVLGRENTEAEAANSKLLQDQGVEVVLGSMDETDKLKRLVAGKDQIFHLAAAQHEAHMPDEYFRSINVEGTKQLMEAALDSGVKSIVHGSTIGVYGILDGVINEESPLNPDNIYGVTKLEGEKLALSYADRIPVTAIRISETYGPGDRRLLKLFKGIKKGVFFNIGAGKNLHHIIYVEDLISGFFRAAESEKARGEVFVLVGEKPITTNEMVNTIAAAVGAQPPKIRIPMAPMWALAFLMEKTMKPLGLKPPLHRRRMDFFRKSFEFDQSKARNLLGYQPEYSFERGAKETATWYENEGLL